MPPEDPTPPTPSPRRAGAGDPAGPGPGDPTETARPPPPPYAASELDAVNAALRPADGGPPRYVAVEKLGEGGMGAVYKAEQRAVRPGEIRRRHVALKVIPLGMNSRQVVARFEAERQALALMSHPNIATVFDAGVLSDGRPFFAMEHVPGRPITEFADAQKLPIERRLRLFEQVCDAVQHAHGKGVIHRDLKPTNVLAYLDGAEPRAKVIDFGLAKALGGRLADLTVNTGLDRAVGTLAYMSPEQVAGDPDIDVRTDVYALGVLLYELLAGVNPFDFKRLAEDEVRRVIREADPPNPSARLSSLGVERGSELSKVRGVALAELRQRLRGELGWIPLKAMKKARTERYETVPQFRADLGRYLAARPLLAGPDSAGYQLRKFLRRNRGPVAAAAAILALLVAGTAGSVTGWRRALAMAAGERRARADAEAERENARAERRAATQAAAGEAAQRRRAELALGDHYEEQGRQRLLDGEVSKALAYLGEAYRIDPAPVSRRFLLAEATRRQGVSVALGGVLRDGGFTPDGARFVAQTAGDELMFVDLAAARAVAGVERQSLAMAVFSPDGRNVAAYAAGQAPVLVRAADGRRTPLGDPPPFFRTYLARGAFSPDGGRLAYVDGTGAWAVADAATGRTLLRCPAADPGERRFDHAGVAPSPSSDGPEYHVFSDARAGAWTIGPLFDPVGPRDPGTAWAPDGTRLVTLAHGDGRARVWDVSSGRRLAALGNPGSFATRAQFVGDAGDVVTLAVADAFAGRSTAGTPAPSPGPRTSGPVKTELCLWSAAGTGPVATMRPPAGHEIVNFWPGPDRGCFLALTRSLAAPAAADRARTLPAAFREYDYRFGRFDLPAGSWVPLVDCRDQPRGPQLPIPDVLGRPAVRVSRDAGLVAVTTRRTSRSPGSQMPTQTTLYDARTGAVLHRGEGEPAFADAAGEVAVFNPRFGVDVWSGKTLSRTRRIDAEPPGGQRSGLADWRLWISADGRRLARFTGTGVTVWEPAADAGSAGVPLRAWQHAVDARAVGTYCDPHLRWVVTCDPQGVARVAPTTRPGGGATRTPIATSGAYAPQEQWLSPTGRHLVVGFSTSVWDTRAGRPRCRLPARFDGGADFSPSEDRVVVTMRSGGWVLFDLPGPDAAATSPAVARELARGDSPGSAVEAHPAADRFVDLHELSEPVPDQPNSRRILGYRARVRDFTTGRVERDVPLPDFGPASVGFGPRRLRLPRVNYDATLLVGRRGMQVSCWDLRTGVSRGDGRAANPTDDYGFLGTSDRVIVATLQGIAVYQFPEPRPLLDRPGKLLAVSDGGARICVSERGLCQVLEVPSGRVLVTLEGEPQGDARFTPDETMIVTGRGEVWSLETGHVLSRAGGQGHALAISPDGGHVVSVEGGPGGPEVVVREFALESRSPVELQNWMDAVVPLTVGRGGLTTRPTTRASAAAGQR